MDISPEQLGLSVRNLSKTFHGTTRQLYAGLDFEVEKNGRFAIMGRNGQGKSTLIKMLGGVIPASSGTIDWRMSSSWPIGFGGGFQGSMSGLDNIKFLARIYDKDYKDLLARVDDFAELGSSLKLPVKIFSSGMRARLAFGLSLAVEFDCYLVDELVSVGDARFQRKCAEEIFEKRGNRAFIMASHDTGMISAYCDRALIVESGTAKVFDDVEEAVDIYTWLRAA